MVYITHLSPVTDAKKIGFTSLISIVIGSQIGSSVFMLPSELAGYGYYNVMGWMITGVAAMLLAAVFAMLANYFPKTGGPHVFVQATFGETAAFYTGWTYWVISWFSSTAVIITAVEYLLPVIGSNSPLLSTTLQILLIIIIMLVNLKGVHAAGHTEIVLTVLKCVPLIIIPAIALLYFNVELLDTAPSIQTQQPLSIMSELSLLMLWGFVGLECATAPAGSVINPKSTIPLAIVLGTLIVALTYLINSIALMGIIPADVLKQSSAPYVDVSQILFGGDWYILMAIITSAVCIGTLNAWVLTSGQIALGLAQDKLFPKCFLTLNSHGAPKLGIVISCLGTIPFLLFLNASAIRHIVEYSGIAFLFVYLICAISLFKYELSHHTGYFKQLIALLACLFCLWVLVNTSTDKLLISTVFLLSGIPIRVYLMRQREKTLQVTEHA
ncbi:MAG: amino acid permease [Legionellales bacterium]|nr:amino acid permease [Legionellales bacterium]